jgi:hypothetical protein
MLAVALALRRPVRAAGPALGRLRRGSRSWPARSASPPPGCGRSTTSTASPCRGWSSGGVPAGRRRLPRRHGLQRRRPGRAGVRHGSGWPGGCGARRARPTRSSRSSAPSRAHANLLWSWQVAFILSTDPGRLVFAADSPGGAHDRPGNRGPGRGLPGPCAAVRRQRLALCPPWRFGSARDGPLRRAGPAARGGRLARPCRCGAPCRPSWWRAYLPRLRGGPGHIRSQGGGLGGRPGEFAVLSLGFGPSAAVLCAHPGSLALLGLLLLSVILAGPGLVRRPEERAGASGPPAFLGAVAAWRWAWVGAVAGSRRAARFADLIRHRWRPRSGVPSISSGNLFGPPVHSPPGSRWSCWAAMCILLVAEQRRPGPDHGREVAAQATAIEKDLRAWVPSFVLIRRVRAVAPPVPGCAGRIPADAASGRPRPFRSLRGNPPFREIPVPATPTAVRQARWEDGTALVTGVDPQLLFTLPETRYVAGLRLRYSHENPQGAPPASRSPGSGPIRPISPRTSVTPSGRCPRARADHDDLGRRRGAAVPHPAGQSAVPVPHRGRWSCWSPDGTAAGSAGPALTGATGRRRAGTSAPSRRPDRPRP